MHMGDLVRFPNCREVSPEVLRSIEKRTKTAAYWVRRWSEIMHRLCEVDPEDMDESVIKDAAMYVLGYLHDRNSVALKARGF